MQLRAHRSAHLRGPSGQRGFGIIDAMIGLAMVITMSYGVMLYVQSSSRAMNQMNRSARWLAEVHNISALLSNPDACNFTIAPIPANDPSTTRDILNELNAVEIPGAATEVAELIEVNGTAYDKDTDPVSTLPGSDRTIVASSTPLVGTTYTITFTLTIDNSTAGGEELHNVKLERAQGGFVDGLTYTKDFIVDVDSGSCVL